MSKWRSTVRDASTTVRDRSPPGEAIARIGLGVVILLAGLHKVIAPGDWAPYLAPLFATRWPISVETTMVLFGLSELPFAAALLVDRYARLAAAVVAVSMLGTLVDLAILLAQTGTGGDVLIRDLAVLSLAVVVALSDGTPSP